MVGTIYLLSVLEAVGDINRHGNGFPPPHSGEEYQSRLKAACWQMVCFCYRLAVGSLPLTTFAQNNGVIQMTGVASRYVGRTIAVMLVISVYFS